MAICQVSAADGVQPVGHGVVVHDAVHSREHTLGLPSARNYCMLSDTGRGVHGIVLEAFGAGNMPVGAVLVAALQACLAENAEKRILT